MNPARDITIRKCTVRVTRRGGWSWGGDAQSLVKRAVDRLPALLERHLVTLGDSLPVDVEIREPLQLRVPLSSRQWKELISAAAPDVHLHAQLESVVGAALARALPSAVRETQRAAGRSTSGGIAPDYEEAASPPVGTGAAEQMQPSALWKLLQKWRAEGRLAERMATLDEAVMRLWLERVIQLELPSSPASLDAPRLPELWNEIRARQILLPRGAARSLALKLLFALEIRSRWSVGAAQLRGILANCDANEAVITDPPAAASGSEARHEGNETSADGVPARHSASAAVSPAGRRAVDDDAVFEADIPCALPFLLLTPLSRAGYLATLSAALEAAHAADLACGVALGLAHKCLAAPQRGWLREAGPLASAAAFAGRQSCDNELVRDVGRALRSQLALLDGCVAEQMLTGHRVSAAWLVARHSPDTLVLFDEDGFAPVATGSLAALVPRIAPSGSVLFVPSHLATAEHLDRLDEMQIPYASDGDLTSRDGCTSFIASDGSRLWISLHGDQQGRARGIAGRGGLSTEAALANWSALHDARPAQRAGVDPAFEVSLSLAAGFGLSAIAWTLWKQRASATALAALENFADLDARVRVTRERVHVILPMGRRAWDLRDHGLLADVREVPWLGARVVTFGVG